MLINLFVLPIALASAFLLPAGHNADMIVLDLPLNAGAAWLAVLAFVGGVSAATGMVAVETLALGTMVSNDLVMPMLLRLLPGRMAGIPDLTRLLLGIRRASIVLLLFLGLLDAWVVSDSYALVSIGLVSFAAAAQLAPGILLGLFWPGARGAGAGAGIAAGPRYGPTRSSCPRSPAQACCRTGSWTPACSGWNGRGHTHYSDWAGWTRSPTRCSGRCWRIQAS